MFKKHNKNNCFAPNNFCKKKILIQPQIQPQIPVVKKNSEKRLYKFIDHLYKIIYNIKNDIPFKRTIIHDDKYSNLYTKCLPHDKNGYVDETQMLLFLKALDEQDTDLLAKIQLGGKGKLINPSSAWNIYSNGSCIGTFEYPEIPKFSSLEMSYYMIELYCKYLSRDIKLSDYSTNPLISQCCDYLNKLDVSVIGSLKTPSNIFRGDYDFDLTGNYISQFLLQDMKIGGFIHKQKYATYLDNTDFMKTRENVISAQNGTVLETMPKGRNNERYLITLRDLACYDHLDEPYQACTNAIGVLNNIGATLNPDLLAISKEIPTEKFFVNFGAPNIYDTICQVGRIALTEIWNIKWKTLVARPEAFGILIDNYFLNSENPANLSQELLNNPVLDKILKQNGNRLLPTAYAEGSPAHPSFASGHAVIAGACVTVIKFFYDINFKMTVFNPDKNGENLIKTDETITIGEELNKLASNIGFGRNVAGIHYRMDAKFGMELGEEVAISCLKDIVYTYPYKVNVYIPKFNGEKVLISNEPI
jgi:hypothetical protein